MRETADLSQRGKEAKQHSNPPHANRKRWARVRRQTFPRAKSESACRWSGKSAFFQLLDVYDRGVTLFQSGTDTDTRDSCPYFISFCLACACSCGLSISTA